MLTLNEAVYIASKAHVADCDKGGSPYILHPIRVMQRLRSHDQELLQIAILHDVVEDHGREAHCKIDGDRLEEYQERLGSCGEHFPKQEELLSPVGGADYLTYAGYLKLYASSRVLSALDCLTRRYEETYEDFIERCCLNYDAVLVKIEDLKDNSDITRLKGLRDKDFERLKKYQKAYARLWLAKREFEDKF